MSHDCRPSDPCHQDLHRRRRPGRLLFLFLTLIAVFAELVPGFGALRPSVAQAATFTLNDRWMGNLAGTIGQRPLSQIVIPGTHDSGTYDMDSYHHTQTMNVYDQLRAGARYLDLRAYYEKNTNEYQMFHGGVGVWWSSIKLTTTLDDIVRFLQAPGHEREIVIANFAGNDYVNPPRAKEICGELLMKAGTLLVRKSMLPAGRRVDEMTPNELSTMPGSPRLILHGFNSLTPDTECDSVDMNPANEAFGSYYANQCEGYQIRDAIRPALDQRLGDGGDPDDSGPEKLGGPVTGFYKLSVAPTTRGACLVAIDTIFDGQQVALDAVKSWYDSNDGGTRRNLNILDGDFIDESTLVSDAISMNAGGPVLDIARPDVEGSWTNTDVSMSFTCRSTSLVGAKPVALQSYSYAGAVTALTQPTAKFAPLPTYTNDNLHRPGPVSCTDVFGRTARVSPTVRIDRIKPSIFLFSPTEGAKYAQNSQVPLTFTCADDFSHIIGCQNPGGDVQTCSALNTASPGAKTITITAKDAAGNEVTKTVHYTVTASALPASRAPTTRAWALLPKASGAGRLVCQMGDYWYEEGGDATQLAVGPDGQPWAIVPDGRVTRRTAQGWRIAGDIRARQIAVGSDGSVWAITTQADGSNYRIAVFNPTTNTWTQTDGSAIRISVGPDGQPWVVTAAGVLWSRSKSSSTVVGAVAAGTTGGYVNGTWVQVSGNVREVAVATNGNVFMLYGGPDPTTGWPITMLNPARLSWAAVPAPAGVSVQHIGADLNGQLWVLTADGRVLRQNGTAWLQQPFDQPGKVAQFAVRLT